MAREVWASADVLVLDGRAQAERYLPVVAQLELCCVTMESVVVFAPALCEDALLAVAEGLASSC